MGTDSGNETPAPTPTTTTTTPKPAAPRAVPTPKTESAPAPSPESASATEPSASTPTEEEPRLDHASWSAAGLELFGAAPEVVRNALRSADVGPFVTREQADEAVKKFLEELAGGAEPESEPEPESGTGG